MAAATGGYGVNHDKAHRPRRQDRPQDLLETGAAYAMRVPGFREAKHRFFGHTALVRTDPAKVLEVDEPDDLARARALAPLLDPATESGTEAPAGARPATTSTRSYSTSTAPRPTTRCWSTPMDARPSPCTAVTASGSPPCATTDCPS